MKNKRFMSLLLCLCMVAALFTGFTATASADGGDVITYTVQSGDWLAKICSNKGLDYFQCKNAIMILNGFTSEWALSHLSIGQVLKLPASNQVAQTVKAQTTTTTTTTTTAGNTTITTTSSSTTSGNNNLAAAFYLIPHTVKTGETLATICNAYETSYNQYSTMILAMNGISDVRKVWAGKTIYIPTTKAPSSGSYYAVVSHKVASGENITSICSQYGISYAGNATLVNGLNGKTSMNKILAGQNVYVPVVSSAINNNNNNNNNNNSTSSSGRFQISFNNPTGGNPSAAVGNVKNATLANAGDTVIISANAKTGYAQQSIKAVRTDSKTNIAITNNSFIMPESDVSVTVTYTSGHDLIKTNSKYGTFNTLVNGENVNNAAYGSIVVIDLHPFPGYSVKSVSYAKANGGTAVTVDPDEYGRYGFYMPNYNTKVTVEYEVAKYYELKSTITPFEGKSGGSIVYELDGSAVTKSVKGVTVIMNLKPNANYVPNLDTLSVKDEDGNDVKLTKLSDTQYTFTMPGKDVTATVQFRNAKVYELSFKNVPDGATVRFNVIDQVTGKMSYDVRKAKEGDTVGVYVTGYSKKIDDKYATFEFKSAVAQYADGTSKVKDLTPSDLVFKMPGANVVVIPNFEANTSATYRYGVTRKSTEHGSFYVAEGSNETYSFTATSNVDIYVDPDPNYVVDTVKYVYYESGKKVETKLTVTANKATFQMPAHEVDIYVTFKQSNQFVTISYTENPAAGTVYMEANGQNLAITKNACIGATVSLKVTPPAGYKIESVIAVGGKNTELYENSDGKYYYTITEKDYTNGSVTFTIEYKLVEATDYNIIYSDPVHGKYRIWGGANLYNAKNGKANEGDTVKIVVRKDEIDAGYTLNKIIVDGLEITNFSADSEKYTYEFKMPAYDVVTKVTFKESAEAPAVKYYVINYDSGSEGVYRIKVNGEVFKGQTTAKEGDTIQIVVRDDEVNSGYKAGTITVDGSTVTPKFQADKVIYEFTMPAKNIDTKVVYVLAS